VGLFRPEPGEPRADKVRRVIFWALLVVALAVVTVAVQIKHGRDSAPVLHVDPGTGEITCVANC
jgi:hypothetical protein